jgi:hypothetical protein
MNDIKKTASMNTNEKVKLVNNTCFDTRTILGADEAFLAMVDNGAPMPEAFEGIFTLQVFTRPSGTKYGVLEFA